LSYKSIINLWVNQQLSLNETIKLILLTPFSDYIVSC